MQRLIFIGICMMSLSAALGGCGSASQQVLPTATPAPTDMIPSSTPTVTPPPTVTPYPTVTPRGMVAPTIAVTIPASGTQVGGATSVPTQVLQVTATSGNESLNAINKGALLFQAGFDQGWPPIEEPTVKVSIIGGKYDFKVGPYDAGFISTTAIDDANVYAEVDVTINACPAGGGYGLLLRQQSGGNYYALLITCSGRYSLLARIGGTLAQEPIATGMLPAGLDPKSGTHTVGIVTQGENFSIYFDGQLVGEASDSRLESGDVALYAFSESDSLIQVAFDNLEVWAVQ